MTPEFFAAAQRFFASDARDASPGWPEFPFSHESQRLAALARLGQLHSQGVLTDAEFAAEKARILAE